LKWIELSLLLFSVWRGLCIVLDTLASLCQICAQLRLENLAWRQQLAVRRPNGLQLTPADRFFRVWLRRGG
jgi:hypothetical protein